MYNRFFTVKTWEVKITLVLRPKEILPAISYPELRHIPVKLKKSSGVTTPFFGHGESEYEIYTVFTFLLFQSPRLRPQGTKLAIP